MARPETEQHPLEPFLPANAQLLMLGSSPPQKKRWSMGFYHPSWNNDMWRITGLLFFNGKDHFVDKSLKASRKEHVTSFLNEEGIVLSDTATSIQRLQDNASNKFLGVVQPINITALLRQLPPCKAIVTTRQKATDTLCVLFSLKEPKMEDFTEFIFEGRLMRLYRMPSSSRACPFALEEKAAAYRAMYQDLQTL